MKIQFLIVLCGLMLSACGTMDRKVSMAEVPVPSQRYVVDQAKPDNYSGFMAAEGNIYSCRYGIHFLSTDEFSPPKAQLFAALLAKELPAIVDHKVVLEQFDVYYNYRLKMLNSAGAVIGGIVGGIAQQVGLQNSNVYTFDKILIDTNPLVERHPGQHKVGCDDAREGEYYASEISGGHDVVVTWLKFTVDAKPYYFRTYYQYQPDTKEKSIAGIKDALQMSIRGIASQIQL